LTRLTYEKGTFRTKPNTMSPFPWPSVLFLTLAVSLQKILVIVGRSEDSIVSAA
jgi:hypothetical protein